MNNLIHIPFRDSEVLAVNVDGKPHVILKPFVESIGLDFEPQRKKLAGKSWACTSLVEVQMPGDRQVRQVVATDVRTALMLLATIDERRVAETARPLLVAYQSEVADAIEAYWTKGGAINPRASEDQIDALVRRARVQMEVIATARGIIDDHYLEAKGRLVLAQAMGEEPELDPTTLPMDVTSYLRDRKVNRVLIAKHCGGFGKRLRALYIAEHGHEPKKVPREVNGTFQQVNGYTKRDENLFDRVFAIMRADLEGVRA
ncbi:phage antirepressor N-terminal domain-containing protein [Oerskovia rustica]|uniref:Phage antirepressor n=1 Tax=Oerskovia rustica TaxID=2762237 RepID=A0ABR8RPD2_9CELL|nr:phage antirepressor N-terminal domain-containing protein [Oerskovia rustica]MBD7949628.1 phage antirepressor [Oerskovia rustica]